ncbi:TetR/AcrR family transcriptional regulator [Cellulomonas sp. DKR-3]|uniref:TetR/AcrR family transcriptional regulator n=1 Tax=Cellulomonas fulva TaxID=2835530 RepID=A0ABS5U1L1_9CELL|nr:TetR/AcrR family transcriptional regulator [Cellulomonas fulva]MBT0995281.1 TetR/AcrR family transcriptional regulator [Cellulomonas fulva]
MVDRSRRAAPLPPEERRAAILRAVRGVVLERGAGVTTRELAQAAGVAEGTLFRVFEDKNALVRATVLAAVDPAADVPILAAVGVGTPLEERVRAVLDIGLDRMGHVMQWMGILHEVARAAGEPAGRDAHMGLREHLDRQERGQRAVRDAIAELLAPDADRFAHPVEVVVDLLSLTVGGLAMSLIDARRRGVEPVVPPLDVVVAHFLHGALAPAAPSGRPEGDH